MSADKRALDDLDALFRAVPITKTPRRSSLSSASRPNKKVKHDQTSSPHQQQQRGNGSSNSKKRTAAVARLSELANESAANTESGRMYIRMLPELLPPHLRAPPAGARSDAKPGVVGAASAARFTEFVRGLLGARGERAATSAIESRVQHKVLQLDNGCAQEGAQSASARAARAAGRIRQDLSGKQYQKKGLGSLKAERGRIPSFRDLVGVHDLWKSYVARLQVTSKNAKTLEQLVLGADLQGSYLTVSRSSVPSMVGLAGILLRETANTFQIVTPKEKARTIPKRGCAFRLAIGNRIITLSGAALEGRRGGQKKVVPLKNGDDCRLRTAAL